MELSLDDFGPIFYLDDPNGQGLLAFNTNECFPQIVGCDLNQIDDFLALHKGSYIFNYLCYDLKNQIERLASKNADRIGFEGFLFYVPSHVYKKSEQGQWELVQGDADPKSESFKNYFLETLANEHTLEQITLQPDFNKDSYLGKFDQIKAHLQRGDIYEVTFCQTFSAKTKKLAPLKVFSNLMRKSKAPFSSFVYHNQKYLLCASPERFLKRSGNTLLSQPIKGTAPRSENKMEDDNLKIQLRESKKEQSENVMIVDLVRNDLSRVALKNSVSVKELFGIYSFPSVHQMISSIEAEIAKDCKMSTIIKALFPMGSMTGAPKISAMQIIEAQEDFRRGLFSGAVGYIAPDGDFDWNVVIRSILYNVVTGDLVCPVGSAITLKADAEAEYQECMWKLSTLTNVLNGDTNKK
jgi:para-aminobenzoate synthetase component 1